MLILKSAIMNIASPCNINLIILSTNTPVTITVGIAAAIRYANIVIYAIIHMPHRFLFLRIYTCIFMKVYARNQKILHICSINGALVCHNKPATNKLI